jgi:hypothetical protein
MRLALGSPVRCSDAPFGELTDIVIDPLARHVTHIIVAPAHDHARARLVPLEWVSDEEDGLVLDRPVSEVEALQPVQTAEYVRLGTRPDIDSEHDIGVETLLTLPVYQEIGGVGSVPELDPHVTLIYDLLPKGEVEIRRSSSVFSSDDHRVGTVDGFLISAGSPSLDLVLERGHLWGRREVVIPHSAIARVDNNQVYLSISKDEVGALPARRVHRWF